MAGSEEKAQGLRTFHSCRGDLSPVPSMLEAAHNGLELQLQGVHCLCCTAVTYTFPDMDIYMIEKHKKENDTLDKPKYIMDYIKLKWSKFFNLEEHTVRLD